MTQPWRVPRAQSRLRADVAVPGSKSETNRALVLAALADKPSTIRGALDARDTELMRGALRTLGVSIDDAGADWRVGPPAALAGAGRIDCGLAGTVLRFVPPIAAMASGEFTFDGDDEARARPVAPLLIALEDLGADLEPGTEALPFWLRGRPGLPGGPVQLDAADSSQFISALLLAGARYRRGVDVRHVGERDVPSRPHIDMTVAMLRDRGVRIDDSEENRWVVWPGPIAARDVTIEPDLSTAAAFAAAAAIAGGHVTIPHWPRHTRQAGDRIREILGAFGAGVELSDRGLTVTGAPQLHPVDLDLADASELTPVVAALAALASGRSKITGVGHIRGHETDRLAALERELNNLGSKVEQTGDGLVIGQAMLHGGAFTTYADHRMAHCAALLGLVVPDVDVDDISCTAKTMPGFAARWQAMLDDSSRYL